MLFVNVENHCVNCGNVDHIAVKIQASSADYIQVHPTENQSFYCTKCTTLISTYNDGASSDYNHTYTRWDDDTLGRTIEDLNNKIHILENNLDTVIDTVSNLRAENETLKRKLANNSLVNKL